MSKVSVGSAPAGSTPTTSPVAIPLKRAFDNFESNLQTWIRATYARQERDFIAFAARARYAVADHLKDSPRYGGTRLPQQVANKQHLAKPRLGASVSACSQ